MASQAAEDAVTTNLSYLLLVLKNADEFKANYRKVAEEAKVCNANTAQKKFKKIVEQAGMALKDGRVVAGDGKPPPLASPKRARAKEETTDPASAKKAKVTKSAAKCRKEEKDGKANSDTKVKEDDEDDVEDLKDEKSE